MELYDEQRAAVVDAARAVFRHGLSHGRTGNVSMRVDVGFVVTPTGCSLELVRPEDLSLVDLQGLSLRGPGPSKEAFLHAALLRARPHAGAVVHTHSPHASAVSCLVFPDGEEAMPPLTAYFAMRVGRLPLLPYFAPGDPTLGPAAEEAARDATALLLSNHGPIAAGRDLAEALDIVEEIEAAARIQLLLGTRQVHALSEEQRRELFGRAGGVLS